MVVIAKSRKVNSSADRVWAALTDWKNEKRYWTNVSDIKVLKFDERAIEREATVGPRAFAQKTKQTIALKPKKSISLSFYGKGVSGERTILVVPSVDGSTKVDVAWSLELRDVPGFVESIVRNQIAKATEDALRRIAEAAESSEVNGSPSS